MIKYFSYILFSILVVIVLQENTAFGANTWYVGEGLKEGDYFRYDLCQVDYKSCTPFEIDFWVENKTKDGDWNFQVAVVDGNKIVKGDMQAGVVVPEPIGFSKSLSEYVNAYKSSIAWLSGFATAKKPQDFEAPAWGKIGSIGGMPVGPMGIKETVTVTGGTFETYVIGWHKVKDNKIWVKDDFPFPIKALTYVDVSSGTIPVQYQFELLEYGNTPSIPDSFPKNDTGIIIPPDCPKDDSIKRGESNLDSHKMILAYSYSPVNPQPGCEIRWNLEFEKSFDPQQFESDVHYDIFVVDDEGTTLRSLSQEEGHDHLFAPVGKEIRSMEVKEPKGTAHYVIVVYGTGPDGSPPDTEKQGTLKIDVTIIPEFPSSVIIVLTLVVAIGVILTRFKMNLLWFKI